MYTNIKTHSTHYDYNAHKHLNTQYLISLEWFKKEKSQPTVPTLCMYNEYNIISTRLTHCTCNVYTIIIIHPPPHCTCGVYTALSQHITPTVHVMHTTLQHTAPYYVYIATHCTHCACTLTHTYTHTHTHTHTRTQTCISMNK